MGKSSIWRRRLARALVFAVAVAATPLPVLAGETTQPLKTTPGIKASVQKLAATERLAASDDQAAQAAPEVQAPQSASFFKTPLGLAVIAVVGAGTGYAIYSTSHDRIRAPGR
jgi:hypothetical protein